MHGRQNNLQKIASVCRFKHASKAKQVERHVNYKMQQPNLVIHSGIVETGTDEI